MPLFVWLLIPWCCVSKQDVIMAVQTITRLQFCGSRHMEHFQRGNGNLFRLPIYFYLLKQCKFLKLETICMWSVNKDTAAIKIPKQNYVKQWDALFLLMHNYLFILAVPFWACRQITAILSYIINTCYKTSLRFL